jgi:hypothetical protein
MQPIGKILIRCRVADKTGIVSDRFVEKRWEVVDQPFRHADAAEKIDRQSARLLKCLKIGDA